MKTAIELAALRQEVKDFKTTFGDDLKEIKTQTKLTNGSIARTIRVLDKVKHKQEDCPARIYHAQPTKYQEQKISTKKIMVIIAAISIIVNILQFIIVKYIFKN